jgi:hypothetical protein
MQVFVACAACLTQACVHVADPREQEQQCLLLSPLAGTRNEAGQNQVWSHG